MTNESKPLDSKIPCRVHVRPDGQMGNWLADRFWLAKREFERKQELRLQRSQRKEGT